MKRGQIIKTVGILVFLLVVFYFTTSSITKYTGFSVSDIDNDFEDCLKEKDIVLYISSSDTIKTLDKLQTSEYLTEIELVNCFITKNKCVDINSFPTWDIKGIRFIGDLSVEELAEITGCEMD